MRVVNEALLAEFRAAVRCEWCKRPTPHGCDPHHVFAKGMGSGGRLDVRVNLIALCRACHGRVHAGQVTRDDLLAVVAAREKCLQPDIEAEVHRLRRTPKGVRV